jgi:cytochrome c oxidase subunit 3
MKTGVIEILPDEDVEPKKGSLRTSGNFPPSGNNGGGDGGDDDKPKGKYRPMKDDLDGGNAEPQDKSKIVTLFLLLVVLMTFGGLIGAYIVISTNNVAEWQPFNLPVPVFISTALIIISSFVYDIGKRAINRNDDKRARQFLVLTTVLGAAFISSQILAWLALVNKGLYLQGNPYAGFFYILTGIHAVHVLGGIVALGAILLRSWNYTEYWPELEYRRNLARSVGWYWHFMGVLWIVLFLLLGFWK